MNQHGLLELGAVTLAVLAVIVSGCGLLTIERTLFPTQVFDAAGNPLHIQDLQEITQNVDLDRDQMIQALRELGLENEELIQAIVDDGLGG